MLEIDHYAYQNRWRTVNPLAKGIGFISLLLIAFCSTTLIQVVLLLVLAPITCYNSHIGLKKYCRWLFIPFAFLLVSVIGILLSFAWNKEHMLVSIPIGSIYIGINADSIIVAQNAFFRSLCCLAVTYLFVLSTPFDQLIQIGKKTHLPKVLLEIILLTYRFIFIFLDEVAAIKRAQTLRFGYISMKTSYHSLGMLITMLLTRVLSRYSQMTIALETKLYKGDFHL